MDLSFLNISVSGKFEKSFSLESIVVSKIGESIFESSTFLSGDIIREIISVEPQIKTNKMINANNLCKIIFFFHFIIDDSHP